MCSTLGICELLGWEARRIFAQIILVWFFKNAGCSVSATWRDSV